jgi:hypothetical protein
VVVVVVCFAVLLVCTCKETFIDAQLLEGASRPLSDTEKEERARIVHGDEEQAAALRDSKLATVGELRHSIIASGFYYDADDLTRAHSMFTDMTLVGALLSAATDCKTGQEDLRMTIVAVVLREILLLVALKRAKPEQTFVPVSDALGHTLVGSTVFLANKMVRV